jgi:mannose-6-phosphate isomerase
MALPLPDVLPMRPYFRELIWGGRQLQTLYGKDLPDGKTIGESFEVSACQDQESRVAAGSLAGRSLQSLVEEYQGELVGEAVWKHHGNLFPLLIKLLDAQDDLSIQVHPDDAYARAKGLGAQGKMEAWYVLHSEGGQIIYGLREGVDAADLTAAVDAGRVEEVVQSFEVKRGDVVFSPPGTVHALCRGVMIYEVQQSSDLTFRIYDYNRPGLDGKPRELHIDAALDVIRFADKLPIPTSWRQLPGARSEGARLVESEHFRLDLYCPGERRHRHHANGSFLVLTLIQGEATIRGRQEEYHLKSGDTVLVPARREIEVERNGEAGLEYLLASPSLQQE